MSAASETRTYKSVPSSDESSDGRHSEDATLIQEFILNRRSRASSILLKVIGGLVLVILYSIALVQITWHTSKAGRLQGTRFMSSPAHDFIHYEARVFHQFERTYQNVTYFTPPDAQVDKNWHDILAHQNLRIPMDMMREIGRVDEGIELPDGGFFGSIMVFHHLHCLKNLYHALHPEYYNLTEMTSFEKYMFDEHNDHCLHMLREAVMCQADTTLVTMKWNATGLRPIGNFTSPHECVNWDRLMEWVVPNSFDALADDVLVHPTLGPVFHNHQFVDTSHL